MVAQQGLIGNRAAYFADLVESAVFSDIVTLDFEQLLGAADLEAGEPALLQGGPPCTPFSKSGYWLAYKRAGEDPKASLLDHYVEALRVIQPKAFLMENVYGLAYANHNRAILERFLAGVRGAGYSHDRKVILAADHGVPQIRQRLFVVGIRADGVQDGIANSPRLDRIPVFDTLVGLPVQLPLLLWLFLRSTLHVES
jgi:site-specific DNA-cytosine methylase